MRTKIFAAALFAALPLFAASRIAPVADGWIAYEVATAKDVSLSCCGEGTKQRVMDVYVHSEGGAIDRINLRSPECPFRTDGEAVTWVRDVSPAESRDFLRGVVEHGDRHAAEGALAGLALQVDGTEPLLDIAHNNSDPHLRGQALFWLSQAAGEKAAAALKDAVNNDPEESVRVRAVFGIAQLPNDQSIPILVDLIEHNRSRKVRKQAAFWLGQKNDPRALAAIEEILRR